MADGAERQNPIEPGVYDPRRDANWQARLEEARAKREIALREKRVQSPPKKRLKPWEEEGAAVFDDDSDFVPQGNGLEFSDRVDAMRTQSVPATTTKPRVPKPVLVEPEAEPDVRDPGASWSDDTDRNVLPMAPRRQSELKAVAPELPENRQPAKASINDIFADPVFNVPHTAPKPEDDSSSETIPIALLRVPPPEPARRRMPELEERPVATVDEEAESVVVRPIANEKAKPEKKRSGLWTIVALFAGAIAVGPIYKMIQPIERGPLVFTLSSFPIDPAFGLTSPMFEMPAATRSREWTPASLAPTDEPLALAKPNVPERTREIADFATDPAFGAAASGILLGRPLARLPDTPAEQTLPVVLPERPIGAGGQAIGLASVLNDMPVPAPRPIGSADGSFK